MSKPADTWHEAFDPARFLARVDVDALLEKNETFIETREFLGNPVCLLCKERARRGLVLNNRKSVCQSCFEQLQTVRYPERDNRLWRDHVAKVEARRAAHQAFASQHGYTKPGNSVWPYLIGGIMLLLALENDDLVVPGLIAVAIGWLIGDHESNRLAEWEAKDAQWQKANPEPKPPVLRHFHDPLAVLSDRDRLILEVFDHWPGYPPYWSYLRDVVLERDDRHCQVPGCPSRLELHVHHRKPVAGGGAHSPGNLVTLCNFHHALEPEQGHERIWGSIKTEFFTLVQSHERTSQHGNTYAVKTHLRRLQLVGENDLKELHAYYRFSCPACGSTKLDFEISAQSRVVTVGCRKCDEVREGPRQLTEETGPKIAELFQPTAHEGSWPARWDMLSKRVDSAVKSWGKPGDGRKKRNAAKERRTARGKVPECPACGAKMKLRKPKAGARWKEFYGCSRYPRCTETLPYE